jgi:NAD(P)H-flavin reductase
MKTKHFKIMEKQDLVAQIKLFRIQAPLISSKFQPGQFVVIRLNEKGERIPLTVAESNPKEGTITIVVQEVGKTTLKLARMKEGETIEDLLGPLGIPSPIKKIGTVICIGGGVGVAPLYPEAKRYKEVGNKVISLIGARNRNLFFFMDKMEAVSDEIRYSTDDGSFGHRGFVTDLIKQILESAVGVDEAVVIGPLPMMKRASEVTRKYNLKTRVSLNSIMVDATGMCGCCRVTVGNEVKFTCVDGPGFNGHLVDFDELMLRQERFEKEEKIALKNWEREHC